MQFTGEIKSVVRDWSTDKFHITFSINEPVAVHEVDKLKESKLSVKVEKYREKRSQDANKLLWYCLGELASALRVSAWEVYLLMLKRYGKFTYICVKPSVVDAVKKQWRECEVIGEVDINGQKAVQMLCYFGSSTLDSKEFSVLLDGVISEMKEMGLETPTSKEMKKAIEKWEKQTNQY